MFTFNRLLNKEMARNQIFTLAILVLAITISNASNAPIRIKTSSTLIKAVVEPYKWELIKLFDDLSLPDHP